jgi:hypothetical protein
MKIAELTRKDGKGHVVMAVTVTRTTDSDCHQVKQP